MTREDAVRLVQAVFRSVGQESPGLSEKGFGGLMIGTAQLFFEHRPQPPALVCRAHIYTFRQDPKPAVLASLQSEEGAGTSTGGGTFEYLPENHGAFLTRAYAEAPAEDAFLAQLAELARASLEWREGALERAFDVQGAS